MNTTTLLDLDPRFLVPPHGVRDRAKFDRLVASMDADGWQGRPLLAWRCGREGTVCGLTGSHRTAAAVRASLDTVPVLVIEADDADLARELDALRDFHDLPALLDAYDVEPDARALADEEDRALADAP